MSGAGYRITAEEPLFRDKIGFRTLQGQIPTFKAWVSPHRNPRSFLLACRTLGQQLQGGTEKTGLRTSAGKYFNFFRCGTPLPTNDPGSMPAQELVLLSNKGKYKKTGPNG